MTSILDEFKQFMLRGSVIDLAVAVVLGVAFGAVVTSLVEDILTPLIAALFGQRDFSGLDFTINDSVFRYGEFINAVISFALIAAAVFFVVVKPYNVYLARRRAGAAPEPEAKSDEVLVLEDIRELLRAAPPQAR